MSSFLRYITCTVFIVLCSNTITAYVFSQEDVNTADEVSTSEDVNTADEVSTSEDVNTADEVSTSEDVNTADEVSTSENVNTADEVSTSEDVNTADEVSTSEDVNTADEVSTSEDVNTADEVSTSEDVNTADEVNSSEEIDTSDNSWFLGKLIRGFDFRGLSTVNKIDLQNVLSEYKNKVFSYELLSEMQAVLYGINFFEEITPEALRGTNGSLILLFMVKELPSVSKVVFIGNVRVGTSTLVSSVGIKRGDIANDAKIDADIEQIKQVYFNNGYPSVSVTSTLVPDNTKQNKNQVRVEFYIDEGDRIVVSKIEFIGNKVFSSKKLRRVILSKPKSIVRKGTFSEEKLEEDKRLIQEEYFKRGFVDASVIDVSYVRKSDPEKNSINVEISFTISEGNKYNFGNVSFEGNNVFSSEELSSLFSIKEEAIADVTKFQRGYTRLQEKYGNEGFIFNGYDYEEKRDEENQKISYVVKIKEFGQSHIENIIVQGNIKTKDNVVLRSLGIAEGSVFSVAKLVQARLNLLNLGYFKSVIPDSKQGSAPGLIDLIFNVEEDKSRDIRFGATFGGDAEFPISLFVSWNQPNVAGLGFLLNSQITASPLEQSISATFTDPRLADSPFSLSTNLSFSHETVNFVPQDLETPFLDNTDSNRITQDPYTGEYVFTRDTTYNGTKYTGGNPFPGLEKPTADEISSNQLARDYDYFNSYFISGYDNSLMTYENYAISFSVGTGYVYNSPFGRLGASVAMGPSFNYVTYDKDVYRPSSVQLRRNLEKWLTYNSLVTNLFYDSRDIPLRPSSGVYISQKFRFYGGILFGDAHYIRSTTHVEGHLTLFDWKVAENWSWKMVLAAQSVFTAILPQIYYPSGRSFKEDGPTYNQRLRLNGIYNARGWNPVYNGQATWNSWVELRMPLYETVIWWDQFFEVAGHWTELDKVVVPDPTKYYFSMGTGFRFVLNQFPIRIYIAKRFNLDKNLNVIWKRGNLASSNNMSSSAGVDLVFTIGLNSF